jgi:hypothetical protein
MFSVGVISSSWLVPILERQKVALSPVHDLALQGHACIRLSGNKWHFSAFNDIHLTAE